MKKNHKKVDIWRLRPLSPLFHSITFVRKIFEDSDFRQKKFYYALGVNHEGINDCLGVWIAENEDKNFWNLVLNDLKNRGVKNIQILCANNVDTIKDTIKLIYPHTRTQVSIPYLICESKCIDKDKSEFNSDLRSIFLAPSQEKAKKMLENFEIKWGKEYPHIYPLWSKVWNDLKEFLDYPLNMKNIITMTNLVNKINLKIDKVLKSTHLSNNQEVYELLFKVLKDAKRKRQIPNWSKSKGLFYNLFINKK